MRPYRLADKKKPVKSSASRARRGLAAGKPIDGETHYGYSFTPGRPQIRRTKFVYVANATYQQVTGREPHLQGAADFVDQWAVFIDSKDAGGWYLTGRNNTEHVRYLLGGDNEELSTCWFAHVRRGAQGDARRLRQVRDRQATRARERAT